MAKIMYVAHEVSRDVDGNIKNILDICKRYHTREIIPFAPYLVALQYLDDRSLEERSLGIEVNYEFFRKGTIDEVGVFGSRVSRGIFGELELAFRFGIPIKSYDKRVEAEVRYALSGLRKGICLMKYLVAERKMDNGNTLFLRHDKNDLVFIESDTLIDSETGKDMTRFIPSITLWDELFDGWSLINKRCENLHLPEQKLFKERMFDKLTGMYQKRELYRNNLDAILN